MVSSHLLTLIEDLCTHLLILHRGRQLFSGTVEAAKNAFASGERSLEEVFFTATEGAIGGSDAKPQAARQLGI